MGAEHVKSGKRFDRRFSALSHESRQCATPRGKGARYVLCVQALKKSEMGSASGRALLLFVEVSNKTGLLQFSDERIIDELVWLGGLARRIN